MRANTVIGCLPGLRLLPHHLRADYGRLPLRLHCRVGVGDQLVGRVPRLRLGIAHHQVRAQPELRGSPGLGKLGSDIYVALCGLLQRLDP